jgi:tryptophan synthase alpha chain
MGLLEDRLGAVRDGGAKAFVPYVTGGAPGVDVSLLRDLAAAGADAIEVGVPHSDPIMDGGVVQEASRLALEAGTHPDTVFETIAEAALPIPVALMTYANIVARPGLDAFCRGAANAGIAGLIVPDLPVDECAPLATVAEPFAIDVVLLAAPGTAPERYAAIGAAAHGFVYCVATYGVTGARTELATTARDVVAAMRPCTSLPLLVGVGIGTPEQAADAVTFADGVIVGSAIMAPVLEGDRGGALELAGGIRAAIGPSAG